MAYKSKKIADASVTSDINVTPMVDVMLVLLIIFMVITPMLSKGKDVDMAKVDSPEKMSDADKDDALLVAVTKDGAVYLGTDKLDAAQLTEKLKDKLSSSKGDKPVFVKADARAKYGYVVDAVDDIRDAGIDQLGLLTDQRKAPGAPPAAGK